VAVAAGCSSGSTSSTPPASSSSPASSASSAATSSAPASSPPATASAAAAGGTGSCAAGDLKVGFGLGQGTAGSVYQVIEFTNVSGAACTLYGYPGVSLATGTTPSAQIGAAAVRSTSAKAAVVNLGPGQTANALLRIVDAGNYPSATCSPVKAKYLQVYPPDQTSATYLPVVNTGCSAASVKLLTIGVLQPGKGGSV
jgi:hypothetical protein